jgi:hypothetical protein
MGATLAIAAAAGAVQAVAEAVKAVNLVDLELIKTGTPEAAAYAKKLIEQRTNLLEAGDLLHDLAEPLRDLMRKIVDAAGDVEPPA